MRSPFDKVETRERSIGAIQIGQMIGGGRERGGDEVSRARVRFLVGCGAHGPAGGLRPKGPVQEVGGPAGACSATLFSFLFLQTEK